MLGDRLRYLRSKTGFRQEDIARRIGVARTTYAMYEQNSREPDNDTLLKIAAVFDTSIDYLLGHSSDPDAPVQEIDPEWIELHELIKQKGAELEATAILRTASKMTKEQLRDILKVFEMIEKD